jgi:hypothetical protein
VSDAFGEGLDGLPQSLHGPAGILYCRIIPFANNHERTPSPQRTHLSPVRRIGRAVPRISEHRLSFHQLIQDDLERRKADIIELLQPLNSTMRDIHNAIVQCISDTLAELKKSNTSVCPCYSYVNGTAAHPLCLVGLG